MSHVFLSYAHADADAALRLHADISRAGYPVWIDRKALLPGQKWKVEIARAIREASAFIALMSEHSVDHRGYVQQELRQALDELARTPPNQIYLLPVRLSDVHPVEDQLRDLHWLDLFPDRDESVARLLVAIATVPGLPTTSSEIPGSAGSAADTGPRFRSMADVFRVVLEHIPPSTPESGATNAFWLTARTTEEGVELPEHIRQRYPKEITFVLQHQYRDLVCDDAALSVTLWFSGEEARVRIPYTAITELKEPEVDIRIA